jgi:hypothetical protein
MLTGAISQNIPFIKKVAMGILSEKFTDKDTALMKIDEGIRSYYQGEYSELYSANKSLFDSSIVALQKGFSQNTFPAMKVSYDMYPEHIGHMETEGCFRCHNDQFKSESGRVITRDCNQCHTIVSEGSPGNMKYSTIKESLEFEHPVDIDNAWKDSNCSDCHKFLY